MKVKRDNLERMNYLKGQPIRKRMRFYISRAKAQLRLAKKKPILAWNIFKFWLHYKLSKRPRMRNVDMMVTGACNFTCTHCYASGWTGQELIPLPDLEKAIKELMTLGVFHFVLQGGEPLLDMMRLKAIVEMCRPRRSYVSVVTNGWLLTPDAIAKLKGWGVDKVGVSLDSGIPDEHDAFRNKPGSFERAVEALKNARGAGLHVGISTTVTHQNLRSEGMQKLFQFAARNKYRININVANMSGRWEAKRDVLLTEEDTEYILKMHLDQALDSNAQTVIGRDLFLHHGVIGCPSTKESLSITAAGDVFPCVFVHIALGNIRDQNIKSMIDAALQNEFLCRWNDKCLGGEDRDFIQRYVTPYNGQTKPLNGREVFGIEGLCRGNRYKTLAECKTEV